MFKEVDLNEFIVNVNENGWYNIDFDYFNKHPEYVSTVLDGFGVCKTAFETLRRRYETLNKGSRTLAQCPRRGIGVKNPSNSYYMDWLNRLIVEANDHFGDVFDADIHQINEGSTLDRFLSGQHELFQMRKMGMFAPFGKNSLTKSVEQFISENAKENKQGMSLDMSSILLSAMTKLRTVDLGEIEDGSLSAANPYDAVYGSNVQGLATGYIQSARDKLLPKKQAVELRRLYGYSGFDSNLTVADNLIKYTTEGQVECHPLRNIVTNLKRVQVGGLDIDTSSTHKPKVGLDSFKKAKYRTINANDPMIQVAEASVAIPFREACIKHNVNFYNTLYDPDARFDCIMKGFIESGERSATQFPFDFELHDARLNGEIMFNLMQHVVKPLYRPEDQYLIDIVTVNLVYKIILVPHGSRGSFTPLGIVGSLGSGDPWTNIYGTLGTRLVAWVLAESYPDIFFVNKLVGCNNGDDINVGIYKEAIEKYGMSEIIKIANDVVNSIHYYFNESKLLDIQLPDTSYVMHWEQYAYWKNNITGVVRRHGSALRYFGKFLSSEDSGRETALEGLMDQTSSINNCIGYVGNQTFDVNAFTLRCIGMWIEMDPILQDYINKHGSSYFEKITQDAVEAQKERLLRNGTVASDPELTKLAKSKILHHLHASGFDKDGISKYVHDEDFSFLAVTKLVGLGAAELNRIAADNKGCMLRFVVEEGKLRWISD